MNRHHTLVALAVLVALVLGVSLPGVASAASRSPDNPLVTAPAYAHTWYITNPDVTNNYNAMYQLGRSDGAFDTQHCTQSEVVLDFGQVGYDFPAVGGGGANYGSYYYAPGFPFITATQIAYAAEWYAQGWFDGSGSCPRLKVLVGHNNYHECPGGGSCDIYTAGQFLAYTTNAVYAYTNAHNISWQVTVGAADDIETDTPNGWDSAAKTTPYVDGYNNQGTLLFYNYGDAFVTSTWSDAQLYYVNWGASHNVPLPEVYNAGNLNAWTALYRNHTDISFFGVMTECATITTPPSNGCANPYNQYSPAVAYTNLYNNVGSAHIRFFATNILRQ